MLHDNLVPQDVAHQAADHGEGGSRPLFSGRLGPGSGTDKERAADQTPNLKSAAQQNFMSEPIRRGAGGQAGDTSRQMELFEEQLPDRPYCTDDFAFGLRVLPKTAAVCRRYVQPQPPWLRLWLVFDYDHDISWYAADEAGLPAPTITVVNRDNGHGHLLYGIDTPVRMEHFGGRRAPANYLADVERAMTVRLDADPSYSGFLCKNPLHRHWVTLCNDHPYTLGELHGWLGDLNEYHLPERVIGIGRNVETFDMTRTWAYRAIREHWAAGGTLETWEKACAGAAVRCTQEHHHPPLQRSECRWIGRSVSRWTWRRFTPERFSAIQRERGEASGKARREAAVERYQHIRELHASGYAQVLIARVVGVSRRTVYNALNEK